MLNGPLLLLTLRNGTMRCNFPLSLFALDLSMLSFLLYQTGSVYIPCTVMYFDIQVSQNNLNCFVLGRFPPFVPVGPRISMLPAICFIGPLELVRANSSGFTILVFEILYDFFVYGVRISMFLLDIVQAMHLSHFVCLIL